MMKLLMLICSILCHFAPSISTTFHCCTGQEIIPEWGQISLLALFLSFYSTTLRQPPHCNLWYPHSSSELSSTLNACFSEVVFKRNQTAPQTYFKAITMPNFLYLTMIKGPGGCCVQHSRAHEPYGPIGVGAKSPLALWHAGKRSCLKTRFSPQQRGFILSLNGTECLDQ